MREQWAKKAPDLWAILAVSGVTAVLASCAPDVTLSGQTGADGTVAGQADQEPAGAAANALPQGSPAVSGPGAGVRAAGSGLIVHEWGTFTSVQGSDGTSLDGLQHEEEALPDFVYGRDKLANHQKMAEGLPEPCNQKMETPVVYFYTDTAQQVSLSVQFASGIISQWFPAVTAMKPKLGALENTLKLPDSVLAGGSVTWNVQVDPALDIKLAPAVPSDSVWQPSRQTAATPLRFTGMDSEDHQVDQTEGFLFYRGLGRFTLPVRVLNQPKGDLRVYNDSADVLPFAVVLKSTAQGKGGVQLVGSIGAHGMRAGLFAVADQPVALAVAQAKTALKDGLVASGLYADEAQAMVDTWQKSWFATPGTRILYILPQAWTEKLLPMQVTPAPKSLVRVLVGRIETLSPQEEVETQQAVIGAKLKGYGWFMQQVDRFLEPRLRRACAQLDPKEYGALCANLLASALHAK